MFVRLFLHRICFLFFCFQIRKRTLHGARSRNLRPIETVTKFEMEVIVDVVQWYVPFNRRLQRVGGGGGGGGGEYNDNDDDDQIASDVKCRFDNKKK